MPVKYFLDTNIIVYSFDSKSGPKKAIAGKLIKNALEHDIGAISYQVIQEFANVALRKFDEPLRPGDCKIYIENFLYPICEIYPSLEFYKEAVDVKEQTGYSFYDSLIVTAALSSGAEVLFTEDLQHNRLIGNLRIANPFLKLDS